MATISMTFTHPAFSRTVEQTMPDAHMVRLAAAVRAALEMPDATNTEMVDAIFWDFTQRLKALVLKQEQDAAAKAAKDGITTINL